MRKEYILPVLSLAGGGVGFFLRWWELSAAFEPETGLPIPWALPTILLIVLSAAMAVAVFFLCRGRHSVFPGGYSQAFQAEGNRLYVTAEVIAAFLFLAAGLLTAVGLPEAYLAAVREAEYNGGGGNPILTILPRLLLTFFCIFTFFCVLLRGRSNYRGEESGVRSVMLLTPAYTACLWLILAYQQRAGDPIVLDYIYELLAIITVLLGFYYIAGFSFERAKVGRTAFFSAMGIYFCVTTLADVHTLSLTLLYCAAILILTANLVVLLKNDQLCLDDLPETPQTQADQTEKEESSDE